MNRFIRTLAAALTSRSPRRTRPSNARTRLGLETLEARDVPTTNGLAGALSFLGLSPGLSSSIQQYYTTATAQPSILDARSNPASQQQAFLNMLANWYNPNYWTNS